MLDKRAERRGTNGFRLTIGPARVTIVVFHGRMWYHVKVIGELCPQ